MRVRWTQAAADDLESISDYMRQHHPSLAQSTIRDIHETILSLSSNSRRGRVGREEGTRELVLTRQPYIIVYRVKDSVAQVLHIYHGAQSRN
jgi:toxin ParE1/3/4